MGSFAGLFKADESSIPQDKRKEFEERIECLLDIGGMMEVDFVQLYGKKLPLLRRLHMTEKGLDSHYNYFEDSLWESVGFDKEECRFWSGKIGWGRYARVTIAAHVLEELYHEGTAITTWDGEMVKSWLYVAWINYLFNEKFHVKNYDSWKLFEMYHYSENRKWYKARYRTYFRNKRICKPI